jgi:hypothetical protein
MRCCEYGPAMYTLGFSAKCCLADWRLTNRHGVDNIVTSAAYLDSWVSDLFFFNWINQNVWNNRD